MGSIIKESVQQVTLLIGVEEPDEADLISKVEIFENGKVMQARESGRSTYRTTAVLRTEPGAYYYFIKVTQADGNLLWSAPVWVTVGQ